MQPAPLSIRFFVSKTEAGYVAQCLEFDIATQAESPEELEASIDLLLSGYAEIAGKTGEEIFAGLKPAPRMFWDLWTQTQQLRPKPIRSERYEAILSCP
jgi:predicted RNase H-like HicB family nuclease